MGLKEPGLRGSLRNTSSVLPVFFDVTITNTNSPVQEGDILTVDYGVDNTGDAQGMQDIRLEIDSVQEDVDPDVMLAGGASATGTLEWDTTGEPEAEYTATVLSDDDSDSVTVEIESPIADSAIHQWDAVDGVLSASSPASDSDSIDEWLDQIGSNDLTGGSPTYDDNTLNGNPVVNFDGVDDSLEMDSPIVVEGVSFVATAEPSVDDSRGILGRSDSEKDYIGLRSDDNELLWRDSDGARFFSSPNSLSEGDFYIVTIRLDGSDLYAFFNGSASPDNPVSGSALEPDLIGQRRDDQHYSGSIGEQVIFDSSFTDGDRQSEEERLSDKWGISLD